MLDAKLIRSNSQKVREGLLARGINPHLLDEFLETDRAWREILTQVEALKNQRNRASEEIGKLRKAGQDTSTQQEEVRQISSSIKELDEKTGEKEKKMRELLLLLPNLPHETVPRGQDASSNQVMRQWGEILQFPFQPKAHWELGESLGILDLEGGSRLSGSMFALYRGVGAKMQRALVSFMIDLHTGEHGYTEIYPPFLVKREIMEGTGQLPKFEEEMYRTDPDDLFLIPTAEVPVTNLHRDEILSGDQLPRYYVAYTACFRREAGAKGADTRGLQRMHQFDKVELVKLTVPETSYDEHEKLLHNAEEILRRLQIPYRVVLLCTGDLGFAASKCYDLEAWAPGLQKWLEVSSCSNFEDFQARRASIRFRRTPTSKPEFVHTLNASGLALPRTFIALLENHQMEDGSVRIPEALQPYMGGLTCLSK